MKRLDLMKRDAAAFVKMMRDCLRFAWTASKFYTILRLAAILGMAFIPVAMTYASKYVLNLLAGAWQTRHAFLICIGLLCGICVLTLINLILGTASQYAQKVHDDMLNARLALMLMDNSLHADLEAFDDAQYYDRLQTAGRDSVVLTSILWNVLSFIGYSVSAVSVLILLCSENVVFGLLVVAASFPSAIISAKYTKALYIYSVEKMNKERQKAYYQSLATNKIYAQDIRLYGIGHLLKKRYERIWKELFDTERKLVKKRSVAKVIWDCLPELVFIGVSVYLVWEILGGRATVGDYSLYTGLMTQMVSASAVIVTSAMQIYDNRLRMSNILKLQEYQAKIRDGTQVLSAVEEIAFEDVCFKYPGTERLVLKHVSFLLKEHVKVAFVGLNGSGKSTMLKLLLRMYEPTSGRILINGRDICEYTLDSLRRNFSVYFQDMQNFCTTLRENVTFSDLERADEGAEDALEKSCGSDILARAAQGLDTQVMRILYEDGMELSGGQHQKLALARTFYRRHSVLVLDEPSSSLDPQAEHDIFESLESLTKDKLTIFTSHRLSNVYLADRIIVLENGSIAEDGTQLELLRNNRRYAQLFRYQQEKFTVKDV